MAAAVSGSQLALLALTCYTALAAFQLRRLERPDFGGSPFFEDTAAGVWACVARRLAFILASSHGRRSDDPPTPTPTPPHPTPAPPNDHNTGNGTRYRILKRAAATQGAFLTVEMLIRPGAPGFFERHAGSPPFHSHAQVRCLILLAFGRCLVLRSPLCTAQVTISVGLFTRRRTHTPCICTPSPLNTTTLKTHTQSQTTRSRPSPSW
jgi:hypothetical protein